MLYPFNLDPWPAGILSGNTIRSQEHIGNLYNIISGIERIIGLNPTLNSSLIDFGTVSNRISDIESGYLKNTSTFVVNPSSGTTGINNNFAGLNAGIANTSGYGNAIFGAHAFEFNNGGRENTAVGWLALGLQTTAFWNTGMGAGAIYTNVSGNENTGIGADALNKNLASNNTAVGSQALAANTTGTPND